MAKAPFSHGNIYIVLMGGRLAGLVLWLVVGVGLWFWWPFLGSA
jgi:hypothetical protein